MTTPQNNAHRGPLQSGTKVGSYIIHRFIGQGGMATVHEAINQDIGKRVALKILNSDLAQQPDMAQRFVNEARSASKVAHPGLISIFDCGKTVAGIYYIAMELLEGMSLERYIEGRGHLGNEECIVFGRQIASALAAVHRHGVVHRDLKPSNIFIIEDVDSPHGRRTKILDFGIAKIATSSDPTSGALTKIGAIMGTPHYMSPEQWRDLPNITAKADVYALGVILYEMAVGSVPFSGSAYQLMHDHFHRKPVPPIDMAPWVRADLSALILRMLKKIPEDRPSMSQVHQSLLMIAGESSNEGISLAKEDSGIRSAEEVSQAASALMRTDPQTERKVTDLTAQNQDAVSDHQTNENAKERQSTDNPSLRKPTHKESIKTGSVQSISTDSKETELDLLRPLFQLISQHAVQDLESKAVEWKQSGDPSLISYLTKRNLLTAELGRTLTAVYKGYLRIDVRTLNALMKAGSVRSVSTTQSLILVPKADPTPAVKPELIVQKSSEPEQKKAATNIEPSHIDSTINPIPIIQSSVVVARKEIKSNQATSDDRKTAHAVEPAIDALVSTSNEKAFSKDNLTDIEQVLHRQGISKQVVATLARLIDKEGRRNNARRSGAKARVVPVAQGVAPISENKAILSNDLKESIQTHSLKNIETKESSPEPLTVPINVTITTKDSSVAVNPDGDDEHNQIKEAQSFQNPNGVPIVTEVAHIHQSSETQTQSREEPFNVLSVASDATTPSEIATEQVLTPVNEIPQSDVNIDMSQTFVLPDRDSDAHKSEQPHDEVMMNTEVGVETESLTSAPVDAEQASEVVAGTDSPLWLGRVARPLLTLEEERLFVSPKVGIMEQALYSMKETYQHIWEMITAQGRFFIPMIFLMIACVILLVLLLWKVN